MNISFVDHYSLIKKGEEMVSEIKIILNDETIIGSRLKKFKFKGHNNFYNLFLNIKEKLIFMQIVKKEIGRYIGCLQSVCTQLEEMVFISENQYKSILDERKKVIAHKSTIILEKKGLISKNDKMVTQFAQLDRLKTQLTRKIDYIQSKYTEYGTQEGINDLYKTWSSESKYLVNEDKMLRSEYNKAIKDDREIPKIINALRKQINGLRSDIGRGKFDIKEIFRAIPDLERRSKESEELSVELKRVNNEFSKISTLRAEIELKIEEVGNEFSVTEEKMKNKKSYFNGIDKEKEELNDKLLGITQNLKKQEDLNQELPILKETVEALDSKVLSWNGKKIKFEKKSKDLKIEIDHQMAENMELVSKILKIETIMEPYQKLNNQNKIIEVDLVAINGDIDTIKNSTLKLKKENNILSIKSTQFKLINNKAGGVL